METQTSTEQDVGQELLADAKGVGSTAVNRLHSEVDDRKGQAATQVKSVSSALESAGQGLDGDAPAWLKSAFTQGAQQVQKFADALEQKDSRQLVTDVSDFARKSPTTFLLGCAAAGFAASRIFQAGAKGNSPTQPSTIGTDNDGGPSAGQFGTNQYGSSPVGTPSDSSTGGRFA